jgi:hypothetical protein
MDYLTLSIPDGKGGTRPIQAPPTVPTGGTDVLSKVFKNALSTMIIIAVVLCLVFLILGGIQWISSGGDKNKIAAARAKITYAVIGLVVALLAFFIVGLFGYFFNVKLFGV